MNIRFVSNSDIDREKWNQLVYYHADGLPYFHSDYLDQVCQWDAMVYGDYNAVMPLPYKVKYGLNYLYTPFMVQQLGVVSDQEINLEKCYQSIPERYKLVELNSNEIKVFGEKRVNTVLNLDKSFEVLTSNYSKNHKRNLKKAGEIEVRKGNVKEIFQLFLNDKGNQFKGFNEQGLLTLLTLIKNTPYAWEIEGAYFNEELVSGVIWVKTHKRIVFLFSGNSDKGKEQRALIQLIHKKIKDYANSGLKMDFEGSNDLNLARFYKGFGGEHCVYGKYTRYLFPINLFKT